ncbi:ABC transporter ATP-binding protein [Cohnella thailandensis]|uniref:ABC transporter ATP-binding protein n=1 Tax=Cohnella thailandensis TaxID=557557 RepID=A0A841T747_9BACL|nr:ABC transporter ATP-binding protein [Cohnella thailandensis]MBB6637677.1 ABC transporter ATP-binding protein [Cohnella thailandensis]MBP1974146.1 peptide/nickel transport system ATP-binding protein [Cohnella thailandensis]
MKPLLQVHNVSQVYESGGLLRKGKVRAVRDVSLVLGEGEVLAVVGESGCGKSTLARMILGLLEPTAGRVEFEGRAVDRRRRGRLETAKRLQMIFQDPFETINSNQRVETVIGRPLQLHGAKGPVRERVLELLGQVGLTPAEDYIDKYPSQLSGGQKQRVMIARALGIGPRVLIADEPTSMLDVSIGIGIMNLMLDLKRDNDLSLLWITHNLGSARYMSDRIVIMFGGQIVESGPTEDVIASPGHPYTRALLHASPDPWRQKTEGEKFDDAEREESGLPESGCRFRNRCPWAREECGQNEIPLTSLDAEREVRCLFPLPSDPASSPLPHEERTVD